MGARVGDFRHIAFIGAGGKTTLSQALARAFAARCGRVALTTTTHIYLPEAMPALILPADGEIEAAWQAHRLIAVCGDEVEAGPAAGRRKMRAPEPGTLQYLFSHASRLVIEADGARGRLLKLHGDFEPVVPEGTALVLIVAGMQAIGQPLERVCHRAARIPAVLHRDGTAITTCRDVADVIGAVDRSGFSRVCAVLNRVTDEKKARAVADRLWTRYGMDSILLPDLPRDAAFEETLGALLHDGIIGGGRAQ